MPAMRRAFGLFRAAGAAAALAAMPRKHCVCDDLRAASGPAHTRRDPRTGFEMRLGDPQGMNHGPLRIFCGNAHRELAEAIAAKMVGDESHQSFQLSPLRQPSLASLFNVPTCAGSLSFLEVEMAGQWMSYAQMSQQLDKVSFDGGLMNLEECNSLMTSTASETGTDSIGVRRIFTDDSDEMSNVERKQLDAESRAIFRKQFRKTQLCRFYKGSGCHMGPDCEFAHGREELQKAPDLRRTSICPRWMQGKCPHSAETCGFAHGANHLRRTIGFQSKPGDKNKVPGSEPPVSRYAGT
ncbi:hypothetical protein AK812_SmicGene22371 [Symbiodinium microadriaticum]|uniref:C3H1-type domain-containing protein n=1 Tax=Symbiodinium microadriaticum TaxID=2951 RepID=A0A1Q9DK03_SYMMI|nr:hypothetical protein AK812_SmicGene22371 [Symbiodinium microadriaticum]